MKELNHLLGLVGMKYENGVVIHGLKTGTISAFSHISLKQIPQTWLIDIKEFMYGQTGPILENGEFGIFSADLYTWVNKNMDKILRHYKIEMITND